MSSFIRACFLACFAVPSTFGVCAIAAAQEANPTDPAGRKGEEVFNKVPGLTTILYLRPEGSPVKKGELVCELDPATLKARLADQEAATKVAEAAYQNARLPREVAELAVTEYLEGTYKQERENLLSKIALAESELKRAEGWLVKSKKMVEEAKLARNRMVSAELAVQRVKLALEQSRMKRDTLEKYTKEKMVKKLQSAVEKARSDELAKQAAYGLARSAQERSQKQIENCRLLAPINGRLHYSKPIEEAADVREGQLLFRVVPEDEPKPGANPEPAEPKGDGVFNPVEGCSTIIAIKPEGSRVAKGELVCELDSSPLKVKLADQQAATKGAVAAYQNAQLVREVTEFAFDGYVYRLYKQDLLEVEGEVASAEVGRKRAEDELARLQRIHEKWGDGPSPIGHKLGLQQKIFALEQAQTRKRVLEAYTGPRMIEKLQRAIEEARSEESARKVALGREQEAEARLLKQLQLCNVFAPASGRLSFPRDIAKGASIREGQLLFRVVPEDDPK